MWQRAATWQLGSRIEIDILLEDSDPHLTIIPADPERVLQEDGSGRQVRAVVRLELDSHGPQLHAVQ